jgi:zinc protease
VTKVEKFFGEELAKALKDGFMAAELAAAKKAVKDQMIVGRSQDQTLLRTINTRDYLDRMRLWDEPLETKMQAFQVANPNSEHGRRWYRRTCSWRGSWPVIGVRVTP